jgi:cytoskeletal protein RodZ
LIAGIVAIVVVIALAVGGFFLFKGDDKNSASDKTTVASTTSRSGTAPTFPSQTDSASASPTDTDTDTSSSSPGGTPTADQSAAAAVAEKFYHAIGTNDVATFCALANPEDLATWLKAHSIPTCPETSFASTSDAQKTALSALKITDPSQFEISGLTAELNHRYYTPADAVTYAGDIEAVRASASGTWTIRID